MHRPIARGLLALLCLIRGQATPAIDLSLAVEVAGFLTLLAIVALFRQ